MADEQVLVAVAEPEILASVPLQQVTVSDDLFRERLVASVDDGYRLASVILGDRGEAEDVAHDAIERAWRSRSALRDADRFEAWFQRIIVNACRDRMRRRRSTPPVVSVEHAGDGGLRGALAARGSDPLAGTAEREALSRALRQLTADQRIVVVLRFYLDLEVDEIARRTGARSGTVKSRLHRALRQLRAIWEAIERAGAEVEP